jgi:HSP20 family protein
MSWELRVLQQRLERLSTHHLEAWAPAIDVYETETSFVVTAEVPGLSREQVDLAFEDTRLTIRGHRSDRGAAGPAEDVQRFHQVERGYGSFARTFEFADTIDVEQVTADLADGVLTITLPKVPSRPARKIHVQ